jgi:hypothetical protein
VFGHKGVAAQDEDGTTLELKVEAPPEMLYGASELSAGASLPARAPVLRSAAPILAQYLCFALIAAIYLLPFMRVVFIGSDEGTLIEGAVRIVHGQVFARDFFEVMGPGTFYWLAAMFKLFGTTFLVARSWLFMTSLGTILAMYFLSRRVCAEYQILPPILLVSVYFSTMWPMVNHHVDSNCFALLSVVCIVQWQDLRKGSLLLAAGALAGVTTCILQPKGLQLLVAVLVWLWWQEHRSSGWMSSIALISGGYVGVVGCVLLYFWSRGALWDLIYMNFVWPSQNYSTVNAIPYATGILQFWSHWLIPIHGVRWLAPVGVVLMLPFLMVAGLPVLVIFLGIPYVKNNLRPEILLYWLCGSALWLSEIHRRDIGHLVAGSPLLLVLCVYYLVQYRGKATDWFLQFLAISVGALAAINLFIVLCVHTVPTRVGNVGMFKPDPVLAFLDNHVAPGTEIFSYPYCPMYYFLTSTANPTRYSLLLYNYNTPAQFREVIRVLEERKVKYVLWNTNFQAKAASTIFSATMYRPVGGLLLEPYLDSHYKVVKDFDGVRILERKGIDHAAPH